jgi:hypothetical protein
MPARDPFAQAPADGCVGTLHVHYIGTFLAHAVMVGTDRQVNGVAGDAGGDVETLGDVAVLGLVLRAAVAVGWVVVSGTLWPTWISAGTPSLAWICWMPPSRLAVP